MHSKAVSEVLCRFDQQTLLFEGLVTHVITTFGVAW